MAVQLFPPNTLPEEFMNLWVSKVKLNKQMSITDLHTSSLS